MKTVEFSNYQITRLDAAGCFVESLCDAFPIGKLHLTFARYDLTKPKGQRQTDRIDIYLDVGEFLELNQKVCSGELLHLWKLKQDGKMEAPLFIHRGGIKAEKLEKQGKRRKDGRSLSRVAQLVPGKTRDLMFIADSGPGDVEGTLIVPKFGKNPEQHVVIGMTFERFSQFMALTHAHYLGWLSSWYVNHPIQPVQRAAEQEQGDEMAWEYDAAPMF